MSVITIRTSVVLSAAIIASVLFFGQTTHAQTAGVDELRATIKAGIMADPRSQGLSQEQVQAMVNALSAEAIRQGITAQQLTERPVVPDATAVANECLGTPSYLCSINKALGFAGKDHTIPVALFIVAALFVLVFSLMREMGHPHAVLASGGQLKKD